MGDEHGPEHGPELRGGEPWKSDRGFGLRVTGMKEEFDKNLKSLPPPEENQKLSFGLKS